MVSQLGARLTTIDQTGPLRIAEIDLEQDRVTVANIKNIEPKLFPLADLDLTTLPGSRPSVAHRLGRRLVLSDFDGEPTARPRDVFGPDRETGRWGIERAYDEHEADARRWGPTGEATVMGR